MTLRFSKVLIVLSWLVFLVQSPLGQKDKQEQQLYFKQSIGRIQQKIKIKLDEYRQIFYQLETLKHQTAARSFLLEKQIQLKKLTQSIDFQEKSINQHSARIKELQQTFLQANAILQQTKNNNEKIQKIQTQIIQLQHQISVKTLKIQLLQITQDKNLQLQKQQLQQLLTQKNKKEQQIAILTEQSIPLRNFFIKKSQINKPDLQIKYYVGYERISQQFQYKAKYVLQSKDIPNEKSIIENAKQRSYDISASDLVGEKGYLIDIYNPQKHVKQESLKRAVDIKPYYYQVGVGIGTKNVYCTVRFVLPSLIPPTQNQIQQIYFEKKFNQQLQKIFFQRIKEQIKIQAKSFLWNFEPLYKNQIYRERYLCQENIQLQKCYIQMSVKLKKKQKLEKISSVILYYQLKQSDTQNKPQNQHYMNELQKSLTKIIMKLKEYNINVKQKQKTVLYKCLQQLQQLNSQFLNYVALKQIQEKIINEMAQYYNQIDFFPFKISIQNQGLKAQILEKIVLPMKYKTKNINEQQQQTQLSLLETKRLSLLNQFIKQKNIKITLESLMMKLQNEQKNRVRQFCKRVMRQNPPFTFASQGYLRGLLKRKYSEKLYLKQILQKQFQKQNITFILFLSTSPVFKTYSEKTRQVKTKILQNIRVQQSLQQLYMTHLPNFNDQNIVKQQKFFVFQKNYARRPIQTFYKVRLRYQCFYIFGQVDFIMKSKMDPTCLKIYTEAVKKNIIYRMESTFYDQFERMKTKYLGLHERHIEISCKIFQSNVNIQLSSQIVTRNSNEIRFQISLSGQDLQIIRDKKTYQHLVFYERHTVIYCLNFYYTVQFRKPTINQYEIQRELSQVKLFNQANQHFINFLLVNIKDHIRPFRQKTKKLQKGQHLKDIFQENQKLYFLKLKSPIPVIFPIIHFTIPFSQNLKYIQTQFSFVRQKESIKNFYYFNKNFNALDMIDEMRKSNKLDQFLNHFSQGNRHFLLKSQQVSVEMQIAQCKIQNSTSQQLFLTIPNRLQPIKPISQSQDTFQPIRVSNKMNYFQASILMTTAKTKAQFIFYIGQQKSIHSKINFPSIKNQIAQKGYIQKMKTLLKKDYFQNSLQYKKPTKNEKKLKELRQSLQKAKTKYIQIKKKQQMQQFWEEELAIKEQMKTINEKINIIIKEQNRQKKQKIFLNEGEPIGMVQIKLLHLETPYFKIYPKDQLIFYQTLVSLTCFQKKAKVVVIFTILNTMKVNSKVIIAQSIKRKYLLNLLFMIEYVHKKYKKKNSQKILEFQTNILGQFPQGYFVKSFVRYYSENVQSSQLMNKMPQIVKYQCIFRMQKQTINIGNYKFGPKPQNFKQICKKQKKQMRKTLSTSQNQNLQLITCNYLVKKLPAQLKLWAKMNPRFLIKTTQQQMSQVVLSYENDYQKVLCSFTYQYEQQGDIQFQKIVKYSQQIGAFGAVQTLLSQMQYHNILFPKAQNILSSTIFQKRNFFLTVQPTGKKHIPNVYTCKRYSKMGQTSTQINEIYPPLVLSFLTLTFNCPQTFLLSRGNKVLFLYKNMSIKDIGLHLNMQDQFFRQVAQRYYNTLVLYGVNPNVIPIIRISIKQIKENKIQKQLSEIQKIKVSSVKIQDIIQLSYFKQRPELIKKADEKIKNKLDIPIAMPQELYLGYKKQLIQKIQQLGRKRKKVVQTNTQVTDQQEQTDNTNIQTYV